MELIEAVSMVFITLLLTVTSQRPQLNYTCPVLTPNSPCQCATLSAHVLDKVQVHCEILKFNENTPDFSAIQTEHTEVLYLKCDSLFSSRFHDNMFSHLHELRELSFIGCKVDRLYPETLRGLDRLRVLNISYDYNIAFKIEAGSFKFTPNLNFLDLSSMRIKELPRSVLCDAENMTYVDLSTNQLQSEETIGYLSESESKVCLGNLKTLKLDGNLLSELTLPLVKHIPDIAKLDLNHNRLATLTSQLFANLTSLQVINLSHNLLPQLPSDIFLGLESLQAVGLDGNQLTCLSPTMFIDNTNLSVIKLGQNRLTAECLPNINHLVALQVLDLSFNQIQNIPRDFLNFTSGSSSMESLYVEGNQLSVIEPDVFHATPFLQFINLSSNSLQRFTPDTELNQLHTLDISNNLLTHKDLLRLDWNLTSNLVQLLISNNKLFQVPQPKVTMHKLVILKLDKNNLTEIADADFRQFPALKLLHLQDNYLRYLPKMTSLPDLNYLDLSWNYLDTVEYGAFSQLHQLQVLNLNYNKLTDIHSLFSTSSVLGVFYVKHNLLHTISSTDVPSQVIHLDLSQNKITSIAVDLLLNLPRLTLADFKENQLRRIYQTSLLLPRPNSHRPFILLSGNYLFCDCNMRYLQDLNDQRPTANGYRYAFIGDITGVLCV